VFVVAVITIMLAAVLVRVQVDRRIGESSSDMIDALTIAESGLQQYLSYYSALNTPPPDGDSVEFTGIPPGGKVSVVARLARKPASPSSNRVYIIRARGVRLRPTLGADPQAVRTVAQYAQWQVGSLDVIGAFAAINDFTKPCGPPGCDGTFALSGADECGVRPSVPGLRVPTGPTPSLGPPQVAPAASESGTVSAVATETGVDWAAAMGVGFTPDYTTLTSLNTWASYRLAGGDTLSDVAGTGLLLVSGSLYLRGASFDWRGVVLVGGKVDFGATTSTISGALISGLNHQTGPTPPGGEWGLVGKAIDVRYNSCRVDSAMASLTGFAAIPNTLIDNWASY
jgi:hypothetical protein